VGHGGHCSSRRRPPPGRARGSEAANRLEPAIGTINPALYDIAYNKHHYAATMHDMTVGNNDVAVIGGGFDTAQGAGTP
jgi:hypothetical protein